MRIFTAQRRDVRLVLVRASLHLCILRVINVSTDNIVAYDQSSKIATLSLSLKHQLLPLIGKHDW